VALEVTMTRRFESRVIVITGGSTGIGRAVARRIASEGAAVVIGARREDVGEEAVREIKAAGGRTFFVATDVTVEAEAASLVRATINDPGRGRVEQLDADPGKRCGGGV
jgi:NAD(P)-dependent dehydrogenase (short-subunit alcohol dehydrogenase family)